MSQKELIYNHFKSSRSLLIVLDACRYDSFIANMRILGDFRLRVFRVYSSGSCTEDWLLNTFTKPIDVVYVSANPLACYILRKGRWNGRIFSSPFRKVVDVSAMFWDYDLGTVRAEYVNLVATRYLLRGENIIVHYIQPHPPFVTKTWLRDTGTSLRELVETPIYQLASVSSVARREFRRAYLENLRYVLGNVRRLVHAALKLGYEVAITADHSELLGVYAPHIMLIKLFRKNLLRYVMNWLSHALELKVVVGHLKLYLHHIFSISHKGLKVVVGHPCSWLSRELYEVPWVKIVGR